MTARAFLAGRALPIAATAVFLVAASGIDLRNERPDHVLAMTSTIATIPVEALPAALPTEVTGPADATAPASREPVTQETIHATTTTWVIETPPLPPPMDACDVALQLLVTYAPTPAWDVDRMMRYVLRETGGTCDPTLRSPTSDTGLTQINDVNHRFLRTALGEWVDRWTLTDPIQNVRAAAALCVFWRAEGSGCYQPWGGGR